MSDGRRAELEAAVQDAETALSDANERGNAAEIQRAETRLSNATERLERYLLLEVLRCHECGAPLELGHDCLAESERAWSYERAVMKEHDLDA